MLHRLVLPAAFAVAALGVVTQAAAWEPEIGSVAKEITTFEYLDGSSVSLEALRGKPLMLYFGADWCPPCQKARPVMFKVANQFKEQGLHTIMFSNDDNRLRDLKRAESAQNQTPIAMPRLDLCAPGKCHSGYRDLGDFGRFYKLPTAILIDRNGVVRAKIDRGSGVTDNLERMVTQFMAQQ